MTLTLTKTGITANESKLERAKNTTFQYRSRELQKEILRNSTTKKIDQKKNPQAPHSREKKLEKKRQRSCLSSSMYKDLPAFIIMAVYIQNSATKRNPAFR